MKSIRETCREMNAIHEIFDPALPRLAPGDDAVTRRALDLLFNGGLGRLSSDFRVLDVGCGNGSQTLCLARELGCRVTALDNHQPYLDELQRRAQAEELSHLIQLLCADMNTLGDGEGEYDLVWAEGSAFVMGISQALRAWRTQLVPGGALGFTDLVWLQDEAPAACRDFFAGICRAGGYLHPARTRLVGELLRAPEGTPGGVPAGRRLRRVACHAGDVPRRDRKLPQALGLVRLRLLPDAQGGLIESSSSIEAPGPAVVPALPSIINHQSSILSNLSV